LAKQLKKRLMLAIREGKGVCVRPVYKRVDTCAEFASNTYASSVFRPTKPKAVCEVMPTDAKKVMVLGGGLNRIDRDRVRLLLRPPPWRCAKMAMKPSWLTATLKCFNRFTTRQDRLLEPLTLEDVLKSLDAGKLPGRDRAVWSKHLELALT
jgi:carbamoyl-phosphate synthase large subunit